MAVPINGVEVDLKENGSIKILKGQSILDKHFLNDEGDVLLTAKPLFVKNKDGRVVELSSTYDDYLAEFIK